MSRIVQPGYSRDDFPSRGPRGSILTFLASFARLVREYGIRGVLAIVAAAALAFAPAALLVWFNVVRYASVVRLQPGQNLHVRPARHTTDQSQDQAGDTALLTVSCEVPGFDGIRPLLLDDDPARAGEDLYDSQYVRREQAYLRPAGDVALPFGLLGRPPLSVWLPPGDYELLVVHESPSSESRVDAPTRGFPFTSVRTVCTLENRRKTECRVFLPHYNWSNPGAEFTTDVTARSAEQQADSEASPSPSPGPTADALRPLFAACEQAVAVPTPGGYLLALPEPSIRHAHEHRGCVEDYGQLVTVSREWTREQLATVRNWLPAEATAARTRLSGLVDALGWREFFAGWYCYAAAGVAGLIFTRWGATAIVEPWQRRRSFDEAVKLTAAIFLLSGGLWLLYQIFIVG